MVGSYVEHLKVGRDYPSSEMMMQCDVSLVLREVHTT